MGPGVALSDGLADPLECLGVVLFDTLAVQVQHAQVVLGDGQPLVGGPAEPAGRLGRVLGHAAPLGQTRPPEELALGRTSLGGLPPQAIAGQLRLYPNPDPVLSMARRAEPKTFAQLLQHAVEADQSSKSGVGTARRNLEALLVRIADTLARRDSRAG